MKYIFGGIALDSVFECDQLEVPDDRMPRMRLALHRGISHVPDERTLDDALVHRSDGRYRVAVSRIAGADGPDWVFQSRFPDVFVFSPAQRSIACHIASDDHQVWQDVLFRRVIPRIATRYGATAIHAAAVAIDDRCLLLLGRSGAGKSTLTAFCAQAGWRVLSDDTSLVWDEAGRAMVEPVQRGIGLWDATRAALSLPPEHCAPMPGYDGRKWWFRPPVAPSSQPRALSAVLILERSGDVAAPELAPVPRDAALRALIAQDIPFLPPLLPDARPDAASAAAFGRIAALARRVPCLRLTYPDGHALLPQTERLLRDHPFGGDTA